MRLAPDIRELKYCEIRGVSLGAVCSEKAHETFKRILWTNWIL